MWNKSSNKVGNLPHYLTCRNGVFYACFRLPSRLTDKPKVIRRSLATRDPGIAQLRLAQWIPVILALRGQAVVVSKQELLEDLVPSIQKLNSLIKFDIEWVSSVAEQLNEQLSALDDEVWVDETDTASEYLVQHLKEKIQSLERLETEEEVSVFLLIILRFTRVSIPLYQRVIEMSCYTSRLGSQDSRGKSVALRPTGLNYLNFI